MSGLTVIKQVASLKRLNSSINGNPRYRVTFTDGVIATTASDAAFCYGIDNPEMRGDLVVGFARSGRIADMRPV